MFKEYACRIPAVVDVNSRLIVQLGLVIVQPGQEHMGIRLFNSFTKEDPEKVCGFVWFRSNGPVQSVPSRPMSKVGECG